MSREAVEFQTLEIGNFTLSIGDLLIINKNVCYILKMVVSDYHGKIHLTVSIPALKQPGKRLTFVIKKFLYQLEDDTIKLIHVKKNKTT